MTLTIIQDDFYRLSAYIEGYRRPVASVILSAYGWSIARRNRKRVLVQDFYPTRDEAAAALHSFVAARAGVE